MNEKDFAENNKILKLRIGSHLYGTNTPTSDEDFSGIYITTDDYYFGLYKFAEDNEADFSKKVKLDTGKNAPEAIDYKLYELRRFAKLASENNPNIMEHLFVNSDNIIFINDYGTELLSNAHLFPSKRTYEPFKGYASSQRHKMVIKEKHFSELLLALEFFSKEFEVNPDKMLVEIRSELEKISVENSVHFVIGDLNFVKHLTVKKVKNVLEDRVSKISNRYELILKYGYDTKFASHWIRLIQEGIDILNDGVLEFPLKNRELILDIKLGKYHIDDVVSMGDVMLAELDSAFNNSKLPEYPYTKDINKLLINMGKRHLKYNE